jgi:hypothetical protein
MTLLTYLFDNIPDIFNLTSGITSNTSSSIMKGGKLEQSVTRRKNPFMILLIILFMILLKGLIVYLLYNNLVPKLIYSLSSDNRSLEDIMNNFKPLSYSESILLVILFNTLFTF